MQPSNRLEREGYLGPVALFSSAECRRIAAYLRRTDLPEAHVWEKGRAAHERFIYDLATRPVILDTVTGALGPDVVLWGVTVVSRAPGERHPWHTDIESCGPEGGFVSVWIGIENTSRDSSLQLIAGSHRLGRSVQEARAARGIARDDAAADVLLELAREQDEAVALVQPDMGDGEAIFFDGRLWHGTDNRRRRGDRLALLAQFAASDRPVRIPDWDELDWPFRIRSEPLPPVILVSGSVRDDVNDVVPPPPPNADTARIDTSVHRFDLPVADRPPEPWRPFPAFRGSTPLLPDMSCHASVLAGGHSPHPPHAHDEEELLIPLQGEVELVIPEDAADPTPRTERLAPGAFVYYPSGQHHTIRNPGTRPAAYLMFKWRAAATASERVLGTEIVRYDGSSADAPEPFATHVLLDAATASLTKLHSHLTVLQPGAGYEPHCDEHDVAIVLLEGAVDTLGRRVEPVSVVYYGAGETHGLRNPGQTPARYLVFEFHAPRSASLESSLRGRIRSRLRTARARRPSRPGRGRRRGRRRASGGGRRTRRAPP